MHKIKGHNMPEIKQHNMPKKVYSMTKLKRIICPNY